MQNNWSKTLATLLVLVLATAIAPAAGAKGGACDESTNDFDLAAYAHSVDVNGALGTDAHYPVVQFVIDLDGLNAFHVDGSVEEWGKAGHLAFEYDESDGLWKTEPILNPTPDEPITVFADAEVGGLMLAVQTACQNFQPVTAV